jgi:outer membrane receptor protein involved in Fe transport
MPHTRLALLAAAILSTLSNASAHTEERENKDILKVEVKGAAQAYNPRRDDTANKIVVTSEELQRYGDTSIADALKRVPGVSVGAGGRDIRMRGLGSGYTQILINGERAPAGFTIENLSPDTIERIEVIRSASAEFSTQAIAGTINIVLKKAVKTASRELKIGAGRSSEVMNPHVSLQLSDKLEDFSYSFSGNTGRFNFDRHNRTEEKLVGLDGVDERLRETAQRDLGHGRWLELSPRLNWTLENGDTITSQSFLNRYNFRSHQDRDIDTPLGEAPAYDGVHIDNHSISTFVRTEVNWVHKFGEGAKLDAKVGVNRNTTKGQWYEDDSRSAHLALDHDVFTDNRESGFSSTGKYSAHLIPGHALAMGWDVGYITREDWRIQRDTLQPSGIPDNADEGYGATLRRAALYAQDEWNLTERWSVYFGLRWEGLDTRSEGPGFDPVQQTSSVWSPLAQTLYKLENGKDQLRAALTRTYKAPSVNDLMPRRFTSTNNSQVEPDYRGNPALKPELATGIDASYEHYWADSALLSAAVAVRRINDFTRRDVFLDDDGRWTSVLTNNGSATVRSLDLEAKFPLKAVMNGAPNLDLRASVSRNWSEVEQVPGPDNRLDQQVPLTAIIGADYKTADGIWSLGGALNLRSGGPVRQDVDRTAYSTMSRNLDMYLLWKFDKMAQLRISAWNLLAQDSLRSTTFANVDGVLSSTVYTPGTRGGRAVLELRF